MDLEQHENGSVGNGSTLDRRLDPRSRMSAGRLNASTMSMRAKSKRKRQANAQHNSNFRAGYVPVDEDVLLRSGIRGRKRYFLYCTLVLLLFVVLLNLMVTAWLIYILGLTHNGLLSIELADIGGREFLRVLTDANIVTMSFSDQGFLGARQNSSLSFAASQNQLKFEEAFGSSIILEDGKLTLAADDITVYSKSAKKATPVNVETVMKMADNVYIQSTVASQVESLPDYRDLSLESTINEVNVVAMEGVEFKSDQEISLGQKSVLMEAQNNIFIEGQEGVFLDPNLLKISSSRRQDPSIETYKLCVCESGRVFRVLDKGRGTTCDVGDSLHVLCA